MTQIAFLMKDGNMGFNEVMNLPYAVFLSLLKQFQLFNLMQDPEYVKELKEHELLHKTSADIDKLRPMIKQK